AVPTYWTVTNEFGPTSLPVPGVISSTTSSGGGVAPSSMAIVGSESGAPVTVTPSTVVASPAGEAAAVALGSADGVDSAESDPHPTSRSGTATAMASSDRGMGLTLMHVTWRR